MQFSLQSVLRIIRFVSIVHTIYIIHGYIMRAFHECDYMLIACARRWCETAWAVLKTSRKPGRP